MIVKKITKIGIIEAAINVAGHIWINLRLKTAQTNAAIGISGSNKL